MRSDAFAPVARPRGRRASRVLRLACLLTLFAPVAVSPLRAQEPLRVVAAENFYGDVATQIGGSHVAVSSILSNPDEDPHLFEASPSIARTLSIARIAIENGAGYDPWMNKLLAATRSPQRQTVVAGQLVGSRPGANPHLWYDPPTLPAAARALAARLSQDDPSHAADYAANLARFLAALQPVEARIAALHARYAGLPVTASEPVFGYMTAAIGLAMRNQRFQLAVMNDAEPAAGDVAAMEGDLRQHRVRLFIYNSQASDSAADRLLRIARAERIPVLGVTETMPRNAGHVQDWIMNQLAALDRALSAPPT